MRPPQHTSRMLSAAMLIAILLAAGCSRNAASREALHLKRGKEMLAKQDLARASLEFRNAAQAAPKDAEPVYQMALIAAARQDAKLEIRLLRRVLELDPKHAGAKLKLAGFELGSSDPETLRGAQDRIREVLAANPNDPDAVAALAMSDVRLGKTGDAIQELRKSLEKFPGHLQSALNLAKLSMMQGDTAGAEAVLKQTAGREPKAAAPALALAALYLTIGKTADAEAQIRRAMELEPQNATALLAMAALKLESGDERAADALYRRASNLADRSLRTIHAIFAYQQGKHGEAISELVALSKRDPQDRDARSALVSAYEADGRANDAVAVLEDALKKNPKDTDAILRLVDYYLAAGRVKQVEDNVNRVLHINSNSAEAHYALARVAAARGESLLQHQHLDQALQIDPTLLPARVELSRGLLRLKDASSALQVLDHAPPDQRALPVYIAARNWVLLALDRNADLRAGIDRGLAIAPTPVLRYQDAILRMNQKDYAGARTVLGALLKDYPESTSSLDLMAQTYSLQGQMGQALSTINDHVVARPNSAQLKYLSGVWQLKAKQPGTARQAFAEALVLDPAFLPPALLLAEMRIADSEWSVARRQLQDILARNPNHVRAEFLIGLVEERSGNVHEAISAYRKVVARNPKHEEALNNLAFLLASEDVDEALKYAETALEISPENPATQDTIGWVYYRKGHYARALSYLKGAVATEPTALRRCHLGLAYAKTGDVDQARSNLNAAVQQDLNLGDLVTAEKVWEAIRSPSQSRR